MEQAILDFIEANGNVTFGDLEREIPGFTGDVRLTWEENQNVVFWLTVSEEAVAALHSLEVAGRIELEPIPSMTYRYSGGSVPSLPEISEPSHRFNKPHWLPLVLRLPRQ